jgi:phospholipid/cholesterol/gamma-HCH transport system substrate-binding protein
VATLVRNLATLADGVKGHSQYLTQILDEFDLPVSQALSVLDEFRKSQLSGADFTRAALRLLAAAGIRPGVDVNKALDRALENVYRSLEALKRTPVIMDNIPPPPEDGAPVACSQGRAQLPEMMDVLLNGQRVVLCKK